MRYGPIRLRFLRKSAVEMLPDTSAGAESSAVEPMPSGIFTKPPTAHNAVNMAVSVKCFSFIFYRFSYRFPVRNTFALRTYSLSGMLIREFAMRAATKK